MQTLINIDREAKLIQIQKISAVFKAITTKPENPKCIIQNNSNWWLAHIILLWLLRCLLLNLDLFHCHVRIHGCGFLDGFRQSSIMIDRISI
jgi:hypothetical protein